MNCLTISANSPKCMEISANSPKCFEVYAGVSKNVIDDICYSGFIYSSEFEDITLTETYYFNYTKDKLLLYTQGGTVTDLGSSISHSFDFEEGFSLGINSTNGVLSISGGHVHIGSSTLVTDFNTLYDAVYFNTFADFLAVVESVFGSLSLAYKDNC